MSKRSVSIDKYNKLKYERETWYRKALDLKEKYNKLYVINDKLESVNEQLSSDHRNVSQTLEKTKEEVERLLNVSECVPDQELVEELECENKNQRKSIRSLKKDIKDLEEKFIDRFNKLERDIMLKDAKIQQLEDTNKDLKERYKDLKDDYREQQRWNRDRRNQTSV
jgi:chromosome segregation ATPase